MPQPPAYDFREESIDAMPEKGLHPGLQGQPPNPACIALAPPPLQFL